MTELGRNFDNLIDAFVGDFEDSHLPKSFRTWGAISAIAGALGRRSWYIFPNKEGTGEAFRIFPQQYIVLIADPGVGKTASLIVPFGMAYETLSESVGTQPKDWTERFKTYGMTYPLYKLSARVTSEQLMIDIHSVQRVLPELTVPEDGAYLESAMTLVTPEFGSLMERYDKPVQLFLTDAWDGNDYAYRTKNSGKLIIKKPALNWIACSTPEEFVEYMPPSAKGQGLLSRMVIVYYPDAAPPDDTEYDTHSDHEVEMLTQDLSKVAQIMGRFTWESTETYDTVRSWVQKATNAPSDPKLKEYNNRRKVHLFKLLMCVSAARRSTRVITLDDFEYGVALLEETESFMPLALQLFGTSETGRIAMELTEQLKAAKHMSAAAFTRMMLDRVRTPAECNTLFMAMKDAKLVEVLGSLVKPGPGAFR